MMGTYKWNKKKSIKSQLNFKFYSVFLMILIFNVIQSNGQTIFSENIGSGSGTQSIAATTFQNGSPITFSGTGDTRTSTASSGYTGSSGGKNVFLTNTVGTNFQIAGISTVGYSVVNLSFGAYKSTTASNMSELILEYSVDGTNYFAISIPAQPTGTGTAIWRLISNISLPAGALGATNLRLRWRNNSTSPQFRIDDISLVVPSKYWDTNGATAGVGGTGIWGATFSTDALGNVATVTAGPTDPTIFGGLNGTVTLGASQTVASLAVNITGYTFTTSGSAERVLTGDITLANVVQLNLAPIDGAALNIGSVTGGTSSSLRLTGNNSSTTQAVRVNLAGGKTIAASAPITIATTGSQGLSGFVSTGGTATINANIANSSGTPTMLGATSGNTLTVNGVISGTTGLQYSAGTSGGAGTINVNGANTYTGNTIFNAANSAVIRLGNNSALPSGTNVTMANTSSNGGILDLNGFSPTISSLANGVGVGSITNNGASASTLTINGSTSTSFGLVIGNGTSTVALTKNGTSTLTLTGANTYTGATTITGGTLELGAANVISNSSNVVLNGGTLRTGATSGFSETVGTLNLNANSTIALGTGNHTLTFANSSAITWAGTTLTITGWTGTAGSSGTGGKIVVGAGGLTGAQLAKISFSGYPGTPIIVSGEVVPPAPAIPTIVLSSPAQTGANNISVSSTNNILSHFEAAITVANATLNTLSFTTTGSYLASDLTGTFKLFYHTSNVFSSASSISTVSVGAAGTFNFTGITQVINSGTTGYFWIVADASASSGGNRTLAVSANPTLTFASGTPTGTISVGGTKTFVDLPTPTISISGSLSSFGTVCISSTSSEGSYSVSGTNLTNNITITPPVGFEISLTSGSGFVSNPSTITLIQSGGNVASTTIFARFVPGSAGLFSDNISHTSTGASTQNVAVSGTGNAGTVGVSTTTASSIATTTASSGGTSISTTCGTITAKGVVWGTSANPTVPNINSTNDGTGTANFTGNITGLSPGTVYNYRAYATNSNGITSYGSNLTFTTLSLEPTAHTASFSVTSPTSASLTLNFSAASTITNAAGYIIIRRTGAAPTGAPTDATGYSVGNTIGDGTVAAIINSTSTTSTVVSGLTANTNYHFTLIPFGYNGIDAASYNYYTVATIPSSNGTTLPLPVTILTFDFAGLAGDEVSDGSNFNNPNLNSSTITRGSGLTASGNADRFNATNWALTSIANAVSGNKYMQFTITPNSGFQFSLASITISIQRSATGPSAVALRSSVDSYVSNLDTEFSISDNTSTQTFTFNFVQSNTTTAVTYRIYMYAEATGGSGGIGDFTGDDLVVSGTVTSIGNINTGVVSTSICAGTTNVNVPFTYSPSINFPNGITNFTAQLSDALGSFSSPTVLQSITSDGTGSQAISADIPTNTITGTGYRIRVTSSSPSLNGTNNGSNITIQNSNTSISPSGTQNLNPNQNGATLNVSEGATPSSRQWAYSTVSGGPYTNNLGTATTQIPNFSSAGTYYIVCKTTYGLPCNTTIESNEVLINVTVDVPTVSTTIPNAINENSASSGGDVTDDGGASVSSRGVVWGTSLNPTIPSVNSTTDGTGTGIFTSAIASLSPQTEYFVRAYATNSAGTAYGSNSSFFTLSNPPTNQAFDLIATPVNTNQIDLFWDAATFPSSGATVKGYVLVRAVSPAIPTLSSSNGFAPAAGVGVIVSSSIIDPSTTFSNTGLAGNTTYNYLLVPYCWDGTNSETFHYLTSGAPVATATTPPATCTAPTIQASAASATSITSSSAQINWTLGNGSRTLVVIKLGSASTNLPIDGVGYTGNNNFGLGSILGTNEFVCFISSSPSTNNFTVAGLASSSTYHYAIYTFDHTSNCYLTPGLTGSFSTLFAPSIIETFEPSVKASYTNGNLTGNLGQWNFDDALIGTSANDRKIGARSARLINNGTITMLFDKTSGLGTVNIKHAKHSTDGNSTWRMEVSSNGGATFDAYQSPVVTTSTIDINTTATFIVNIPGDNIRIRIVKLSGGTNRLNIDDISLGNYTSPNTISTGTILGSPFCITNTSGLVINVPFTSVGLYNSENVYTAQLSDATGSFAIPTAIGTLNGSMNSGVIAAEIPAGTFNGSGYRIRVISSSPEITGSQNITNLSVFLNTPDASGFFASISTPTSINLGWTNPTGCFDQILIVGSSNNLVTALPTGDGALYTASSTFGAGGSGANLPTSEFAIFKNSSGTSVNVTGLTTGTTYYFKLFIRKGTQWSDGIILSATPVAINVGDYRSNGSGNYSSASTWQVWNGTAWVAASNYPNSAGSSPGTINVTVRNPHTIVLDASRSGQAIRNLTVESGARIWAQDSAYNGNRYLTIYGDILCLGNIGRGANLYDNISFNIEGNPTTISGNGNFNASRLRKSFNVNTTTNLIIAMNMGLKFASGVGSSSGTVVYNNNSSNGNKFNVTINENSTLTIRTSIGESGNLSIDGIDGEGSNERGGKITVNGTLIIPGTLFALTDNLTETINYEIGTSGIIKCVNICTANEAEPNLINGSRTGGCIFTIKNGGKLEMTGGIASNTNTYNKPFSKRNNTVSPYTFVAGFGTQNNTFNLEPGSIVEYSSNSGTMPIQSSNLTYSNLVISGAAIKTINSTLNINRDLTILSPAILDQNGNNINIGGDWNSYGSNGFAEGTSTVNFNGTSAQKINCSSDEDFYNLDINNNTTNGVELNCNITIANDLDLGSNGRLFFGSTPSFVRLTKMTASSNSIFGNTNALIDMSGASHDLFIGCELPSYSGIFDAGTNSTVTYNRSSVFSLTDGNQNIITNITYANLALSGTDNKNINNNITVNADILADGSTTRILANNTNTILNLGGNFTLNNDAEMNNNCFDNLSLNTLLNENQTFTGNNKPLQFFNFNSLKNAGNVNLQNPVGNTTLRIKNNLNLDFSGSALFSDNQDSIIVGNHLLIGGLSSNSSNYNFTGNMELNGINATSEVSIASSNGNGVCVAELNNLFISTGNNSSPLNRVDIRPLSGAQQLRIKENLTILQGTNGALLASNDNNIEIGGNWISYNQSGFLEGISTVIFNGNNLQNINTNNGEIFYNLTLNKPLENLNLLSDVTIENQFNLSSGIMLLNAQTLEVGTSSNNGSIINANSNSYISTYNGSQIGNLRRRVNNTGLYNFPIGDNNYFTPASVSLNQSSLSSAYFDAFTVPLSHPNLGVSSNYLQRYWSIEPSGFSGSLNYAVSFTYNDADIIGSESTLFPYKYSSLGWMGAPESAASFTHGSSSSINLSTNTFNWFDLYSFSDITGIGNGTPLPVTLVDFNVIKIDKIASINWKVASEVNCDYYEIEKTKDAKIWQKVFEIEGKGNYNGILNYDCTDDLPFAGKSYYRLKQVDFDGTVHYSELKEIYFENDKNTVNVIVNSNDGNNIDITINGVMNQVINCSIYDLSGRLIVNRNLSVQSNLEYFKLSMENFSEGLYLVNLRGENVNESHKVIKSNH